MYYTNTTWVKGTAECSIVEAITKEDEKGKLKKKEKDASGNENG